MDEHVITPEVTISKIQHRYRVGYVRARHINNKTYMITYYSQHLLRDCNLNLYEADDGQPHQALLIPDFSFRP